MVKMFSALKKDSIGGAGVHVDTALGNDGKPKKKPKPSDKVETVDCGKSAPQSLYICRPVTNAQDIIDWAKAQGFAKTLQPDDLHVTIAFSRQPLDWKLSQTQQPDTISVPGQGDRVVAPLGDKGAVVLKFHSNELHQRWQQLRDAGASWDYPGYQPHVSITYDGTGTDLANVKPYDGRIELGSEQFAPVDDDWSGKVVEKQDFSISFEITKMDADKQQIFGWASVATINGEAVVDKQGDIIPIDELEKAAYDFLLDGGVMGDMHERVGVGRPIESMVFTKAKCDALGIKMDREGWFVGFQVDSPDVWKSHKEGKRPEFSIGGSGVRQPQ